MLRTREELEASEDLALAPYAQRARESAGRRHAEPQHPFRTMYQRDRARIIHSRAFRRLEYKTQVFLNGTGDHLRTRLTHTMEVASVSRTIAHALGANADLAECIALAHDLGHSPYGHSGEARLNDLMKGQGGFEHNIQSLRLVDKLEIKYPTFPGLNLSWEVLEGLRKHDRAVPRPTTANSPEEQFPSASIEAQIANLADEITYYSHDLDDGLDHELIRPEQLESLELWQVCAERVRRQFPELKGKKFITYAIRSLIDQEVADLIQSSHERIEAAQLQHADEARRLPGPVVSYSDFLKQANQELRKFLFQNLYYHPRVNEPNERGCEMIEQVFRALIRRPHEIREYTRDHEDEQGLRRTICDYISGMTDRFLQEEYRRLVLEERDPLAG